MTLLTIFLKVLITMSFQLVLSWILEMFVIATFCDFQIFNLYFFFNVILFLGVKDGKVHFALLSLASFICSSSKME